MNFSKEMNFWDWNFHNLFTKSAWLLCDDCGSGIIWMYNNFILVNYVL